MRHDDIPCIISGREDFLNTDDVRGLLSFFRCLQDPGDMAALRTALKLLWNCPSDLIEYAQKKICSHQTEWDLETLQYDFQGYETLLQMLERIEAWLPLIQKEKPWKSVQQWEDKIGSSLCIGKTEKYSRVSCQSGRIMERTGSWARSGYQPVRLQKTGKQALYIL